MKAVILAGGKGSRISEESIVRPKPMVTIGSQPILWHIMKIYDSFGIRDFIVCCGYKGEHIKRYFVRYGLQKKAVRIALSSCKENGQTRYEPLEGEQEAWRVVCANTGLETKTAGRILAIRKYLGNDSEFMLTYGDGLADIDLQALLDFHRSCGKTLTISITRPEGRFGAVCVDGQGIVKSFREKARRSQSYVNMGFMVADMRLFDYLGDGSEMLERGPFERLAATGQLAAYKHPGFWSPMDTVHDREYLESLWHSGAPWKIPKRER